MLQNSSNFRYDLTGECRYSECNLQHVSLRNGKSMTMEEIFLDLISYCPHLLKDENGKQLEKSTTMAEKLLVYFKIKLNHFNLKLPK